jgi:hypothetical protein
MEESDIEERGDENEVNFCGDPAHHRCLIDTDTARENRNQYADAI